MAGNNSPDILKRFKMILINMKNNKMISLSEFNEILNIFLFKEKIQIIICIILMCLLEV